MRTLLGLAFLAVGIVVDQAASFLWALPLGIVGLAILARPERPSRNPEINVRIKGSVRVRKHWWSL